MVVKIVVNIVIKIVVNMVKNMVVTLPTNPITQYIKKKIVLFLLPKYGN